MLVAHPSQSLSAVKYISPKTSNNTIKAAKKAQKQGELDPIDLSRGEFVYTNTLMAVPAKGLDFSFDVSYKNQSEYDGLMGYNRDHNWNQYLIIENDTISYVDGQLNLYVFEKDGSAWKNIDDMSIVKHDTEYILTKSST